MKSESCSDPFVSVIVPCFNASSVIAQLLYSLEAQTICKGRYEVICIDNGSSDNTLEALKCLRKNLSIDLKLAEETLFIGSYAARNKGIELAKGDLFFFTDADCCAKPEWIEQGLQMLLERGPNTVCGGAIELVPKYCDSPSAVEMFEMILGFSQRRNIEENGYAVTANLMCWRNCVSKVGKFNSNLRSKGDFEWCSRARNQNFSFVYVESAKVFHPARRTLSSIVTKTRRVTGGQFDTKKLGSLNSRLNKSPRLFQDQLKLVLTDRKFPRFRQKSAVLGVACLVFIVKNLEKLRLHLGKQSERK